VGCFLVCAVLGLFIFSTPEMDLIALVNSERVAHGVAELAVDWEVSRLARYRVEEMVRLEFFGHESRLYGEPDEMLVQFGVPFVTAGVNIATGQETAEEVVSAWLNSAAHRENLLNEEFTAVGVGLSYDEGLPYWTIILVGREMVTGFETCV